MSEFDVVSVGDCVIDNLFYVNKKPDTDETVSANGYVCALGGKGANACVASARLGSKNAFISKIGNDFFGKYYMENLEKESIDVSHVTITEYAPTSTASILVEPDGKNSIVVNFGATFELTASDLDNAEQLISKCKILITSLVLKPEIALYALKLAKKNKLTTIFNCAPAFKNLDAEFALYTDILVVNESEAEALTNVSIKTVDDAREACKTLMTQHVDGYSIAVAVTLGANGCVVGDQRVNTIQHYPARQIKAVDSIGAGDSFVGSLAHYLSKYGTKSSESLERAVKLASEYASFSVERKGAQTSYLHLKDLDAKFH